MEHEAEDEEDADWLEFRRKGFKVHGISASLIFTITVLIFYGASLLSLKEAASFIGGALAGYLLGFSDGGKIARAFGKIHQRMMPRGK
jgi:hypothetical protein